MDGNQLPYDVLTITFGEKAFVASVDVLQCARQECTAEEIVDASRLPETFVRGVAGSLKDNNVFESELTGSSNTSLMRW